MRGGGQLPRARRRACEDVVKPSAVFHAGIGVEPAFAERGVVRGGARLVHQQKQRDGGIVFLR
jgi:hypothetical protein